MKPDDYKYKSKNNDAFLPTDTELTTINDMFAKPTASQTVSDAGIEVVQDGSKQAPTTPQTVIQFNTQPVAQNTALKYSFSNEQIADVKLDDNLRKEFKSAKIRNTFIASFGVLATIIGAFFIGLWFAPSTNGFIGTIPSSVRIPIFFGALITVIGLASFIYSMVRYSILSRNISDIKTQILGGGILTPASIKKMYLSMRKTKVSMNFATFWIEFLNGIAIGLLWALTSALPQFKTLVANCDYAKIVCYVIAGGVGLIWLFTLIYTSKHQSNIDSMFNITTGELKDNVETAMNNYTKDWWIFSIIFTVVLLFAFYFVWSWIRKKNPFDKASLPFSKRFGIANN